MDFVKSELEWFTEQAKKVIIMQSHRVMSFVTQWIVYWMHSGTG